MNILHIEAGRRIYGGAKQVLYLLQRLVEVDQDNQHVLVCTKGSEVASAAQRIGGIDCIEIQWRGDLDALVVTKIYSIIKNKRIDLVHVHSRRGAEWFAGISARLAGVDAICTRRVDNPEPTWVAQNKFSLYSTVYCISKGIERVVNSLGVEHTQVIRSAVDTDEFAHQADREWFEREFKIKSHDLVIANFAQMIPRKGQVHLIRYFDKLCQKHRHLQLMLFGKGKTEQELRRQAALSTHPERIHFPGFRHDVARILPNIDILAHPANAEGLGVILLQAASSKVACVGMRAGGVPEAIADEKTGYVVDNGNHEQFIHALELLITNETLRQKMGDEGRKRMVTEFSISAMTEAYLMAYQQLS